MRATWTIMKAIGPGKEDDAEGFLEADDDVSWVHDEESYSWFQRRKIKHGLKAAAKAKETVARSSGGRKAGQILPVIRQMLDAWQPVGQ